jgi:hypothetical protein
VHGKDVTAVGFRFDARELTIITDSLSKATAVAPATAAAVVTKAAVNIKTDARQRVAGLAHAPAYPASIGFDPVHVSRLGASTIVGPDKDKRQGALGNLIEYGSVKNAPIPHFLPAGEAEEPKFAKAMEDLSLKALGPGFQ